MTVKDFQHLHDKRVGFKRSKYQFFPNPYDTRPGGNATSITAAKLSTPGQLIRNIKEDTANNYEKKEIFNQILDNFSS